MTLLVGTRRSRRSPRRGVVFAPRAPAGCRPRSPPRQPLARRRNRSLRRPRCPRWRPSAARSLSGWSTRRPTPCSRCATRASCSAPRARGDARVTIDGQPARVWPNGAWLAYVALPLDSLMRLRIEARRGDRLGGARLSGPPAPVPDAGRLTVGAAWLDSLSLAPTRPALARPRRVPDARRPRGRGRAGAAPARRRDDRAAHPPAAGRWRCRPACAPSTRDTRGFGRRWSATAIVGTRCAGRAGRAPIPGPECLPLPFALRRRRDTVWAVVEAIVGADTARARWPLQVAVLDTCRVVAELDDDTTGTGIPDSMTVGRARPRRHLRLVLPDRHARRGHRPPQRRPPPPAVAGRRGVGTRGRRPPARARRARAAGDRRLGERHAAARSRHRAHSAQPARAVPGRGDRSLARRHLLRRRRATSTGCATGRPIRWCAG